MLFGGYEFDAKASMEMLEYKWINNDIDLQLKYRKISNSRKTLIFLFIPRSPVGGLPSSSQPALMLTVDGRRVRRLHSSRDAYHRGSSPAEKTPKNINNRQPSKQAIAITLHRLGLLPTITTIGKGRHGYAPIHSRFLFCCGGRTQQRIRFPEGDISAT